MPIDNPYSPPRAPVEALSTDESSQGTPPIILVAIFGLAVLPISMILLQLIGMILLNGIGNLPAIVFIMNLGGIAVRVWLLLKVWQRRNWARITLAVLVAVGVLTQVVGWTATMRLVQLQWNSSMIWLIAQPLVAVVSLALLFTPSANRWFRRA